MTYKNRFDGGELDKWCLGAVDDPMFQRGCAWLENFNLLENGGLNRRKGYKRFCKILEGLDDEAIKMVPLPVDSKTGYVLFVTRNRFGAVKFTDGEFDSLIEKPWPGAFVIDDAHTFVRRKTDPDAFWYLPHPEAPIYIQSDDELPVGGLAV